MVSQKLRNKLIVFIFILGIHSAYGWPGESVSYSTDYVYLYTGTEADVEQKINAFIAYVAESNEVEERNNYKGSFFRNFKTTYYIRKIVMVQNLYSMDIEAVTYKKIFQRLGEEREYKILLTFSYFTDYDNYEEWLKKDCMGQIMNMILEFESYAERNNWQLEKIPQQYN